MKTFNLAILLTCFNRKKKTLRCLSQLYNSIPKHIDVVIFLVDDGSTDGTSEAVSHSFPSINIIQGTGDLYWNRGMHLAWEKASADKCFNYYLLLNDDSFLYEFALGELIDCAKKKRDHAIICGAFKSSINDDFTYGGRDKNGNPVVPNGNLQRCFSINGNCLLVPHKVFEKIGNLDPIFPHAIGDFDYGQRAMASGFDLITTRDYIGTCESNDQLPKWCYPQVPLKERFKALYSPLGNSHPKYYFIYIHRHFGLYLAIKHFLSIHLRLCIPQLWKH